MEDVHRLLVGVIFGRGVLRVPPLGDQSTVDAIRVRRRLQQLPALAAILHLSAILCSLLDDAVRDAEDAHGCSPTAALEDVTRQHGSSTRPEGVAICIGPPPSRHIMSVHP
eukprot:7377433-Prymnesium_polylepis.2